MLRVLFALLTLLLPALTAPHAEPAQTHAHVEPAVGSRAFHMPAANSWIAWSFLAHTDALVTFEVREPPSRADTSMQASALLLVIEGDEDAPLVAGGSGHRGALFSASANGRGVRCCDIGIAPGSGGASSFDEIMIPAGRTAWLAFVGANLDPSASGALRVDVRGGTIVEGERKQGTQVTLTELVESADGRGTAVQVGAVQYAVDGSHADVQLAPRKNGFLMATLAADGGARMRAWAMRDAEAALHATGIEATAGVVVLMGTDRLGVGISELERPMSASALVEGRPAHLSALVLTADLDVPGRAARAHLYPLRS